MTTQKIFALLYCSTNTTDKNKYIFKIKIVYIILGAEHFCTVMHVKKLKTKLTCDYRSVAGGMSSGAGQGQVWPSRETQHTAVCTHSRTGPKDLLIFSCDSLQINTHLFYLVIVFSLDLWIKCKCIVKSSRKYVIYDWETCIHACLATHTSQHTLFQRSTKWSSHTHFFLRGQGFILFKDTYPNDCK